ncbi:unnamed protein product [Ascophyllum nodosum]
MLKIYTMYSFGFMYAIYFILFLNLTYSRWASTLPSCLNCGHEGSSHHFPGSRLTTFLSRCKFSNLTTRQPMDELYLLTFPRFPLRKKENTNPTSLGHHPTEGGCAGGD